jgi:hypothetical protein
MNRRIRDEILGFLEFFLWIKALRRFSQSKFHFDFEDDSRLGPRRLRSLSRYLLKIAV